MLSLRFAIVIAAAGLCLWGLFSLLDTLREPGLLQAEKATVIKGCEQLDSDEQRSVCPQLFCQKAVIDAGLVPRRTRFAVSVDEEDGAGGRLIGGSISNRDADDPEGSFACVLEDATVVAVRIMDEMTLTSLAEQSGDWSLEAGEDH